MSDGFERLFTAEYPRVVSIADRILRDRAEAEDVAQEVFLAFHRKHSPLADYAAAWLHRAATHMALNHVRSRKRRQNRELQQGSDAPATAPAADELVQRSEEQRRVREALARMPKKSAAVLALRASGLTYAETAAALGVGVGQIGTLLRRAEVRLLKEVSE
ncbi:MAG TPA: sigma-70 family RNA polymerase sigma factor [Actinomycetota bacterium]|nr:sigma-70 family RNA polymerase sigma factor [Actinomycetota bacterium]